jgi:hypothetical protein
MAISFVTRHLVDVMVRMLVLNEIDHGFKPWLGQIKDYQIDICWFSAKYATLRNKSKN